MDLLKDLLFRQVNRNDFNSLKDKWKTLIKLLEKNNEKPLRFLRYFIMSNYKVNNQRGEEIIREEEIYKWFIRPEMLLNATMKKSLLSLLNFFWKMLLVILISLKRVS